MDTLLLLIALTILVGIIVWPIIRWVYSGFAPETSVKARAVKVRDETDSFGFNRVAQSSIWGYRSKNARGYDVLFETLDGKSKRFFVQTKHGKVAQGDHGILTFKGIWFVGFAKKTHGDSPTS